MHDGLEDGGEGRDPDAGADEDGVLGVEDLGGGRPEGSVDVDVQRLVHLQREVCVIGREDCLHFCLWLRTCLVIEAQNILHLN